MYGITHPYIIMPSLLILFGIYALIQSKKGIREDKFESLKRGKEKHIPDLLWKMHRRMMELVENRIKEDFDAEKFQNANDILADSTGVLKFEEQEEVIAGLRERLGKRIPKTTKGKKKLSKKLLRLSKEFEHKMQDKEWSLADLIKIGEALDGQQMGIGNLRDSDNQKWKRWYDQLREEKEKFDDDELDKLIIDNIFTSYGCCSQWLHTIYLLKMENELTELIVSRIRGVTTNMKINIDRAMEEKTRPIIERIKKLQT
ncbi:hypothetical protein ES707_02603 [subsurface metagenome]